MRTAHLIVSGSAFAVWTAAVVAYCVMCDNAATREWYLYGPAAVLPAFWCVYAWFAVRRTGPETSRQLMLLPVPLLICGLGIALVVAGDVSHQPPDGHRRHIGMGVAMVGECCWPPAALCGLVSFIWAIRVQVKGHFQPPREP